MFDIHRFASQHSLAIAGSGHHHCHAGWIQLHCLFCSSGSGFHLGFNLKKNYFNCWRCGNHSLWDVVGEVLRTSDKSKIKKEIMAYETDHHYTPAKLKPVARRRRIQPPPHTVALGPSHRKYLHSRHYDPSLLETEWDLKGTRHLSGQWSWRIIFPVQNLDGRTVAYGGRTIGENVKRKYKMSDNKDCLEDPKSFLYGIERVPESSVVIVEGPSDVWRLGYGAIAALGIDWTIEQANILRQFEHRFILFDPESLAQKQADKLAEWLSFYPGETELIDGLRCDPGNLSPRRARRLMGSLGF